MTRLFIWAAGLLLAGAANASSLRMDIYQGDAPDQLELALSCVVETGPNSVARASHAPMSPVAPSASNEDIRACAAFSVFIIAPQQDGYHLQGTLAKVINIDNVAGLGLPAVQSIELSERRRVPVGATFKQPFDIESMSSFYSRAPKPNDKPMKRFGSLDLTRIP